MKRRILSFVLALALLLSFAACGGKQAEADTATVTLPEVSPAREAAEQAGAFAVDQYIYARMKTEALIEYKPEAGNAEEFSAMIEETLTAWRVAEAAANGAEQIASVPESLAASPMAATMRVAPAGKAPFFMTASAAEENAATKWARDITEKFDSYPANARIKTLAQELGVDAKSAYKQLQMAQDILKGDAEAYEGDLYGAVENALLATRTVCKTTLYVTGTIASAGTASALEVGCILIGGVDTAVDIAATGSTIIRGENDSITLTLNEVKDYLAPVSAVAGGIGFFSSGVGTLEKFSDKMGLLDKFTYVGDSLLDYYQGKKVLGVKLEEQAAAAEMTITQIEAKEQSDEAVRQELEKAGLPFAEAASAKSASEIVSDMEEEMGGVWTVEDVEAYFGDLSEQYTPEQDAEANPAEAASEDPIETGEPAVNNAPSEAAEIYSMTTTKEDGLTDTFPAEVLLHEDGTMEITFTPHRVTVNDDFTFSVDTSALSTTEHLVGQYDSQTHTFTGMGNTGNSDDAWNWATTVLTFDPQAGTASGILGAELEGLAAASFTTQITLLKQS